MASQTSTNNYVHLFSRQNAAGTLLWPIGLFLRLLPGIKWTLQKGDFWKGDFASIIGQVGSLPRLNCWLGALGLALTQTHFPLLLLVLLIAARLFAVS